jgi:putative drug exporter of the RND superfamily
MTPDAGAVEHATTHVIPTGPFARLGRWSGKHRRWVIAFWIVLFIVLVPLAGQLEGRLSQGGFEISGSTSQNAGNVVAKKFTDQFPANMTVVLSSTTLSPSDPAFQAVINNAAAAVKKAGGKYVGGVVTPAENPQLAYPGAKTALIQVGLTQGIDQVLGHAKSIIDAADAQQTSDVTVGVTGGPAIFTDFNQVNKHDLQISEAVQIPLILLVLVVFFGSLWAAGIPVVVTVIGLLTTLGALWFVAGWMSLSIYVQNVVPLIGIGIGVDYSLFIVNRYRDELHEGFDPLDAAAITVGRAGKAIFFSGLTVAVALAGMLAVGVPIFTGFAVGTIGVVIMLVSASLTLTPAILVALHKRLDRLDVVAWVRRIFHRPPRRVLSDEGDFGFWGRWANGVMRRPWTVIIVVTAVLLLLASPVLVMKTGSSGVTALPTNVPSRVATGTLVAAAGQGAENPISIVIDGDGPVDRQVVAEVSKLTAADPQVSAVNPVVSYAKDGTAAVVTVYPKSNEDTQAAQDLAGRIADTYGPQAVGASGERIFVGGAASSNRDFTSAVAGRLPYVVGLVMILTFIVLTILFRSLVLPLKAVVMTLLSVLAAYGVMVAVFQWGWLDGPLRFTHLGHVTNWVPAFMFSILFGLSMDYEVFLLSRVREYRDRGGSDTEAVAFGLARTGRIITTAALLMIIVFLSFGSNRLIPLKEMSLGLAVAILIDATLVRLLLVPAFMRLAGKWNWWLPKPLAKIIPVIEE